MSHRVDHLVCQPASAKWTNRNTPAHDLDLHVVTVFRIADGLQPILPTKKDSEGELQDWGRQ